MKRFLLKINIDWRKNGQAMRKMRIIGICLLCIFMLSLTACAPPEGYSREHYTYEDAVAYAKAIDPNAVVYETYTDTVIPAVYDYYYREWDAVIHGMQCHVTSHDVLYGEFLTRYYVMDTDYDYYLLEKILGEKQPDWQMGEDHPIQRYNPHNLLMVETPYWEAKEELSVEELEQVWADAEEIYQEYSAYPIRKELRFIISVPHTSDTETVHLTATWFFDFTEEGKRSFFERYAKKWDLMESGLPFVDE